jgi:hypothetical protein
VVMLKIQVMLTEFLKKNTALNQAYLLILSSVGI